MMAVEQLEVLSYGGGEVVHPTIGCRQRILRGNQGAVRSIGLSADMSGARVFGPELIHRAHQNNRCRRGRLWW